MTETNSIWYCSSIEICVRSVSYTHLDVYKRQAGWNNAAQDSLSKTEWQIVRDNVFTFFNLVFVALAACLFAVGAYRDMMFLGILAANVFIGIVQELSLIHI